MKYRYDFHIHSALSPCAEEEMTPNNIVNMAIVNGLDLIALTDHNSVKNLPALMQCAKEKPLVVVPGIEVETVEEVHISCLFSDEAAAMKMGQLVQEHLSRIPNQEDIFGPQYIFDQNDRIIGKEEQMLLFSTQLTVEEVFHAVWDLDGGAYFSHVDRTSYSVLSVLGTLPQGLQTGVVELTASDAGRAFAAGRSDLEEKSFLYSSDAHRLVDMSRGEMFIELPVERENLTARDVINWIKKKDLR